MNLQKKVFHWGLVNLLFALITTPTQSATHKAICSYYSSYEPCLVRVSANKIETNFPGDFISIDKDNFITSELYKEIGKSSNIAVGVTTTVLLGPIGLLGFLVTKKMGTVDFGFSFLSEKNRKRTAFIRFKNLKAADNFAEDIKPFLAGLLKSNLPTPSI